MPAVDGPLVEFFQLVPNARKPQKADRAVGGTIPARALRYCEAITGASGFGWYVFLPMPFQVLWDGHDILWTYHGVDGWLSLWMPRNTPGSVRVSTRSRLRTHADFPPPSSDAPS